MSTEGTAHPAARMAVPGPRTLAVAGALVIAFSSILVELAEVSPATAAFFRCLYAVPLLVWFAAREDARLGPRSARDRRLAALAGIFFAADLIFWHYAIGDVGAGLSTVLANVQVVLVPLIAWLVMSERPGGRALATVPVVLAGVLLISGALEDGAYGDEPVRGAIFGLLTGVTYAGFILLLRAGSTGGVRIAGPLSDATVVAAVAAGLAGAVIGDLDLLPGWESEAWLITLALSSQVLGWMLISAALPRLPPAIGSLLLTVQPVGSVALGAVLLGEEPSGLQLVGVALIVSGLVAIAVGRRATPAPRA